MVSSRDPSCRTSLLRKSLEHDAAMSGSISAGWSPLASQSRVDGFGAHGSGILASERGLRVSDWRPELIFAAFDLDPSGGNGEVPAFLQACVDAQHE